MHYADGEIVREDDIEKGHMALDRHWAESYRHMNEHRTDRFGDRVADALYEEHALIPVYVVKLDNAHDVQILKTLKCMKNAQIGDRIRIGSKTRDFGNGRRDYYNLSRGPPPMKPLKKYLNEVHKGGDACDYEISYGIQAGNKQGKYVWKMVH
tara:strand:- start:78 stop:536 length:459 start_codon:yes stop_codon:yes gene_type:complete